MYIYIHIYIYTYLCCYQIFFSYRTCVLEMPNGAPHCSSQLFRHTCGSGRSQLQWHEMLHLQKQLIALPRAPGLHTGGSALHTGGSDVHTGGSALHTGGSALHTGGSDVHTGGSTLHTGGSALHTGGSALHSGGSVGRVAATEEQYATIGSDTRCAPARVQRSALCRKKVGVLGLGSAR